MSAYVDKRHSLEEVEAALHAVSVDHLVPPSHGVWYERSTGRVCPLLYLGSIWFPDRDPERTSHMVTAELVLEALGIRGTVTGRYAHTVAGTYDRSRSRRQGVVRVIAKLKEIVSEAS